VSGNVLLSNPSEEPYLEVASVQITLTPLSASSSTATVKPVLANASCPVTNKKILVGPAPGMLNCSYTVRVSDIGPYIATATASTPVGQRSNSKNAIQVNFAKAGQTSVGDCVTVSEGQSVDTMTNQGSNPVPNLVQLVPIGGYRSSGIDTQSQTAQKYSISHSMIFPVPTLSMPRVFLSLRRVLLPMLGDMPRVGDRFSRAEKRVVNGVQETFCSDCRAWDSQQHSRWYELHGPGRCYGSDGSEDIEAMGSQEDAFDGMDLDQEPPIEDILAWV